jgi:hypothetical protein
MIGKILSGLEATNIVAIIGSLAVVLGGAIAGFWSWLSSRKRTTAEAEKIEVDAAASVMNGFILLLKEIKEDRALLVIQMRRMDVDNHKLNRRINQLERMMIHRNIKLPEPEANGAAK